MNEVMDMNKIPASPKDEAILAWVDKGLDRLMEDLR